jgi:SAM-dependent methyltransferase
MGKSKHKKHKNKADKLTMAERADKHVLYEKSVQSPESEIDFIDATYLQLKGRRAAILREDFCGTANNSCEWIRRRPNNTAYGIDIDAEVLAWGRQHHLSGLERRQTQRIHLINADVLKVQAPPVDVVLAMNFSYFIFRDRATMKKYFKRIYRGLKDDGVLFLDAFGGYEAFRVMEESTKYNGFTYIWDQAKYNPITGDGTFHIHFKFKDGSRLREAFTYHWRVWTLPELTELLEESGFRASVYWEGSDADGEGNGVYTPAGEGDADAGWVVYIVATK